MRGPNIRANCESLYMQRLMFTLVVARNLGGPAVVVLGALLLSVLDNVSMPLAVAYVPKYREYIRRKGREVRKM